MNGNNFYISKTNPLKYWTKEQFEISSYKYHLVERVNKIHTTSGSDNSKNSVYTYNELGFRGESINKKGFKIMSLGCSITEGVGVNDDETWPRQFSKLIPDGVDLNFGTAGRSNDFITRCLISYFDFIKPDLVLVFYTFAHRREIYTDNNIEPYISGRPWGYMEETEEGKKHQKNLDSLQNDNEDLINWYKNHLLIKNFLHNKKCNWVWNARCVDTNYTEDNRYDGSPLILDTGTDNLHPGPKTHTLYSKMLYEYICNRHPTFINVDKSIEKKLI